ncbi:MAG: DUF3320 domain-containing protein [Planctomycetota bacterium]
MAGLTIAIDCDPQLGLASALAGVPLVNLLQVDYRGEVDLDGARLEVRLEGLSNPWVRELPRLRPGQRCPLVDVPLVLDRVALEAVAEETEAELVARVLAPDGEPLAAAQRAVRVLPPRVWGGLGGVPEVAAAFVWPLHPAFAGAAPGAAGPDPERARRAVEDARRWLASLPAGVPRDTDPQGPQAVRPPDALRREGGPSALERALVVAAFVERAGCPALLVWCPAGARVGLWTTDASFVEPSGEGVERVARRVQLGELLLVDPLAPGEVPALAGDVTWVDLLAARRAGVRPLALPGLAPEALRSPLIDELADVEGPGAAPRVERWKRRLLDLTLRNRLINYRETQQTLPLLVPDLARFEDLLAEGVGFTLGPRPRPDELPAPAPPTPEPLDPEVRATRATPALGSDAFPGAPHVRELGHTELGSLPTGFLEPEPQDPEVRATPALGSDAFPGAPHVRELGHTELGSLPTGLSDPEPPAPEDPERAFLRAELERGALRSRATPAELEKRAVGLFRSARTAREETGANPLYLALGFLRWFESPTSETPRRAPILLLPARLERVRSGAAYRLRLSEEDAYLNVTLLEKLKLDQPGVEVRGLDELPEDAAGLDVVEILARWEAAVADLPRWGVEREAQLALLSFTKFLMWRDLEEHTAALLQNPLVQHLALASDQPFPASGELPEAEALDRELPPGELYCPRDADSSQLVAIQAASRGRTFVLQGPPGTGKSQTITNLIAHALGSGKRVLFVSEKMAALNVVHERLKSAGLEAFCLELHSNKARKKEVLARLGAAWEVSAEAEPEDWERRAERLAALRAELNAYAQALHRRHPLGLSVFEVTSRLCALRDAPRVGLGALPAPETSAADFARLSEHADRVERALVAVGPPGEHPLAAVGVREPRATLRDEAEAALRALLDAAAAARQALSATLQDLSAEDPPQVLAREALGPLRALCAALAEAPGVEAALLTEPGWRELRPRLEALLRQAREVAARRAKLVGLYGERFLDELDHGALATRLEGGIKGFVLWSWWTRGAVRKEVAAVASGQLPDDQALLALLLAARELARERDALREAEGLGPGFFGARWRAGAPDVQALARELAWADRVRALLPRLELGGALQRQVVALASVEGARLAPGSPLVRRLSESAAALDRLSAAVDAVSALLALDLRAAWGSDPEPGFLERVTTAGQGWLGHLGQLHDWGHWRRVEAAAREAGLAPLLEAAQRGELEPSDVRAAFARGFYEGWLHRVSDRSEVLRTFNRHEHERKLERFRELDRALIDATRGLLRARLAARVPPRGGRFAAASESGILSRQLELKARHMPLRKLFRETSNLLPRLVPCLLMSPLSVAQYLDPVAFPGFDLVVFDEASQIPVWDAIGAIARAEKAVVVGDSQQLPPTSFFSRGDEGPDAFDEDELEEAESILDECTAANLPTLHLRWHYRSQHEGLIVFSNAHYYDNRLLTFPCADEGAPGLGVELRHLPQAVYDRGGARTNRLEAEAVVAEVTRRLRAGRNESLGVVTFSRAQQDLIETLLDAARQADPSLEGAFGEEAREPVFVKNLENVQGDERDVILFSVCYGPDAEGHVALNFGPLNRTGGERRLNVAITRARRQVLVFTALTGDEIDLSRTQAVGAKHLKAFLDYARRGTQAIATPSVEAAGESALAEELAAALRERGWVLEQQVGCSGYRIDVAVKDPEDPARYLLGVELDGANYQSAKTARDRDRLRQGVLEALGWRLCRVWSGDWLRDPAGELARVEAALREAQAAPRPARDEPPPEPAPEVREPVTPDAPGESGQRVAPREPAPEEAALPGEERYRRAPDPAPAGDPQRFYATGQERVLAAQLEALAAVEAPLPADALLARIAPAWGIGRITQKVRARFEHALRWTVAEGRLRLDGEFVWRADQDPASYRAFRVPGPEDEPRKPEEIAPQELANAAGALLAHMISAPSPTCSRSWPAPSGSVASASASPGCWPRGSSTSCSAAARAARATPWSTWTEGQAKARRVIEIRRPRSRLLAGTSRGSSADWWRTGARTRRRRRRGSRLPRAAPGPQPERAPARRG